MHKYFVFVLFLSLPAVSVAQQLHAVYEYTPSAVVSFREQVYYDGVRKIAVRDSIPLKTKDDREESSGDEVSNSFNFILGSGKNYRNIVIQKNKVATLQETRSVQGVNYLVSDQFPALVWNTQYPDIDTLGKYVCRKATASYRGTTLVAHYTDDIPVPVGPSRFGGLPGLIVMLYNESAYPNYWYLKEVNYPYTGSVPISESYVLHLPKLTLKEFVQKEEKIQAEQLRILESKLPVSEGETVVRKTVRGGVEQVYEWER